MWCKSGHLILNRLKISKITSQSRVDNWRVLEIRLSCRSVDWRSKTEQEARSVKSKKRIHIYVCVCCICTPKPRDSPRQSWSSRRSARLGEKNSSGEKKRFFTSLLLSKYKRIWELNSSFLLSLGTFSYQLFWVLFDTYDIFVHDLKNTEWYKNISELLLGVLVTIVLLLLMWCVALST